MVALVHMIFAVITGIICVTSTVLNTLVCLVFFNNKRLLTPPNIFIVSVAVCDLLYSVTCLPLLVVANLYGRWIYGITACHVTGFVATLSGLTSIVHLAAAAYERYIALVFPMKKNTTLMTRRTVYYSLALWAYALFWSVGPLCGWSGYEPEGIGTSCSVRWKSRDTVDLSYSVSLIVACFIFPVSTMLFSYSKCCVEIYKASRRAKETWGKSSPYTRKTFQMERKMVLLFAVMTAAYLVAWTPYAVVSIMAIIGGPGIISDVVASIPAYIAKSSTCFNPILYALVFKRLRQEMISLFRRPNINSRKLSRDYTAEVRHQETRKTSNHCTAVYL